jgi:hypothetical protein
VHCSSIAQGSIFLSRLSQFATLTAVLDWRQYLDRLPDLRVHALEPMRLVHHQRAEKHAPLSEQVHQLLFAR